MPYFFRRRTLRSARGRRYKRRTFLVRSAIFLLVFFLALGALSWISHYPQMTVSSIILDGASKKTAELVQPFVKNKISGRYLGLFSRSNIALIPQKTIEESLLDSFPRIKSAEVSFHSLQAIEVSLKERERRYIWCGSNPESRNQCYFLDEEGVIFTKSPQFSGPVYFEIYSEIYGGPERSTVPRKPLGYRLFAKEEFQHIIALHDALEQFGSRVESLHLDEENVLTFTMGNGVRVLVDRNQNFEIVRNNLQVAVESEALPQYGLSSNDSPIDYVDLRFENKAFYKSE